MVDNLESHGYKCLRVALPSTQSPDLPPATLTDDTTAVRNVVELELNNNDVVVVAHSYGGTPVNNALKDLDGRTRSFMGASTAVIAIAFVCAIPLPQAVSFFEALGGKSHPLHDLRTEDFSWVGRPGPEHYFYNDLTADEAQKWSKLLRQQSWPAYLEQTTYASYMGEFFRESTPTARNCHRW